MATTIVHTRNARTTTAISLDTGDDGCHDPRGIFYFSLANFPFLIFFLSFYFIVSIIQMY